MALKTVALGLLAPAAVAAGLWDADVLSDRRYKLDVVSPARLYAIPPHEYPKPNPVVKTLMPGTPVRGCG